MKKDEIERKHAPLSERRLMDGLLWSPTVQGRGGVYDGDPVLEGGLRLRFMQRWLPCTAEALALRERLDALSSYIDGEKDWPSYAAGKMTADALGGDDLPQAVEFLLARLYLLAYGAYTEHNKRLAEREGREA